MRSPVQIAEGKEVGSNGFPFLVQNQMISMTRSILMIGLPGSGKSFLAQKLAEDNPSYRWISTDTIRGQLFGDEAFQGPWVLIWSRVREEFQEARIQQAVAIYDATNTQRRRRRDVIREVRRIGFTSVSGVWVNSPLEVCLHRNRMRSRQVPEDVILKMHRQLTDAPPTLQDGFDRLIELGGRV